MANLKTYLQSLLNTFGLDYENSQSIPLTFSANQQVRTTFVAPSDGFLILFCGTNVHGAFIADTVWGSNNVSNIQYSSDPNWCSCNCLVSKGRTYELGVGWSDASIAGSQALFVPFTFSRQSSN